MDESQQSARLRVPVTARRTREVESYAADAGGYGSDAGEAVQRNVLAVIWQRRWLVVACVLLSLAAGVGFLMRSTRIYGASSTLYVQQSAPKILGNDFSTSSDSASYIATQCEVIKSTVILSQAAVIPAVANIGYAHGWENIVGRLKSCVTASPSKQGDLIIVSVGAPSPTDAATVVNGVVEAYIAYQGKQHQSTAVQVAGILQKEMDTHEAELATAQKKMLDLRRENPDLSFRTTKDGQPITRMSDLMQQMSGAQSRASDLRRAARAADQCPTDPAKLQRIAEQHGLGNVTIPSTTGLLNAYQQQQIILNSLLGAHLGPANDRVQMAQAQLTQIREALSAASRDAATAYLDTIRSASETADLQVKELQSEIESERAASTALNAKAAEYQQLQQAAERNERALDVLDGRLKEIRVTEDVGPSAISVLEVAKPDPTPVSPVRSKILAMSLATGLLVSFGLAFLLDKMDHRLRTVAEVTALLDAPVFGVIPRVVTKGANHRVGLEAALRPRSGATEAFRTVRTAIAFGAYDRSIKTILMTSPAAGDGKSTCVSNLAITIAQAGRRTLLIDADCRRPVQHKIFGITEPGGGLSGVLAGTHTLAHAIRPTQTDRLDLLPCGPLPHSPVEMLDSQAMLDLLSEVSRSYDQILIDSPPVNLVSDARVLAAVCDAAILVLRSERSTRHGTRLAWNALSSVGGHLVGSIINDVHRPLDGYGYTYYGYGRYGTTPPPTNGKSAALHLPGELPDLPSEVVPVSHSNGE